MEVIATKIFIGIIIAVVSSFFTTKLALKKFYSEKWWEKKESAYAEIINALYDLIQYCEIKKEDYGQGTDHLPEKVRELSVKYSEAYWKIKKATDIGAFVISKKAESVLIELRNQPQLKWEENPSFEIFEADYNFYKEALEKIIIVSKKDLQID